MNITLFHHLGLQFERGDDIWPASSYSSEGSPRITLHDLLISETRLHRWQHYLLHHLSDDTIGENHDGVTVTECQFEGKAHKVSHFLHTGRSEDNDIIVAVAAATRCLEIVALRGLNRTQPRAATLYVDDDTWNLCTSHITDALLHEGNTR